MTRTIAVTGGTGFVGAAVIEALLARGDRVKALARSPEKLPSTEQIIPVGGSLESEEALARLAAGADAFIHCAGLVRARRDADFFAANVEGARRAAAASARSGAHFLHVSSMSARRPELSPYAASKRRGEEAVAEVSGGDRWITLRVPAVYGPGDQMTLPYFKLVRSGVALEPASTPAPRASILYVGDVAAAILAALDSELAGAVYDVGDDRAEGYSWREIGETLGEVFNVRPRRMRLPRAVVSGYHGVARGVALAMGRVPEIRRGQANEFFHPDWVARDNLLNGAAGWLPATPLKEGFAKTVRWYQENGLL
ncbi:MAG: NAD(P)-dependent oxidoreductase [Parvularculaceae bacterium]